MIGNLRTLVFALLLFTPYGLGQSSRPAYRIQTIAGSANSGDSGPALQALLIQAEGIARDPDGNLYLADAGDHRVRRISPSGVISTYAGTGAPGYSGDNGPATDAQMNAPYGLAVDLNGNLFIADLGNHVIRRVDRNGRITTFAGGGALPAAPESEGSPATAVAFTTPRNIAADPDGNVYISDFDAHRIYIVQSGTFRIYAGTGSAGYGANDIAAIRSALRNPAGLWIDAEGGLLVAEAGAQRIRRIARGIISAYPQAQFGTPLYGPTSIAVDLSGTVYVTDSRAGASLKRTPTGQTVTLPAPGRAVTVDPSGNAYLASGDRAYKVTPAATVMTIAGAASSSLLGDNGPASDARLGTPAAVAFDSAGQLFIADEAHHRIRRISSTGVISTIAGTGAAGYTGDGGPGAKAQLQGPRALAFEANGNLLIADSGNHVIRRLTPAGIISTVAGNNFNGFRGDGGPAVGAMLDTPSGLATDPATGDFYIADTNNHRIRRVSSGFITTVAGAPALSTSPRGYSGDGGFATQALLDSPTALARDLTGNLYLADTGNNRIRRIDPAGLIQSLTEPVLSGPRGVTFDSAGLLYIADSGNHRILERARDGALRTIAGTGLPGLSGDGAAAIEARLNFPQGLARNAAGDLLIADAANHRIRRLVVDGGIIAPPVIVDPTLYAIHPATQRETAIAPGMILSLYGPGLGPAQAVSANPAGDRIALALAETEVSINGIAAPILYTSDTQINLITPQRIGTGGKATVEVRYRGQLRTTASFTLAEAVPGLVQSAPDGEVAVVLPTGIIASSLRPVPRGEYVTLYLTGAGRLNPELADGVIPLNAPFPSPLLPAELWIGGVSSPIQWIGTAPGYPGLIQINVRTPAGFLASGRQTVQLRIGQNVSPDGTFLYLE